MGEVTIGTLNETVQALRDGGGWAVALLLIGASIKGWITWPSERRSLQRQIDTWQSMALELLSLGKTSASLAARMAKLEE